MTNDRGGGTIYVIPRHPMGKSSIYKGLQMKNRIKLSLLSLSLAAAFPAFSAGNIVAEDTIDSTENVSVDSFGDSFEVDDGTADKFNAVAGINPNGHSVTYTGNEILVDLTNTSDEGSRTYGIYASGDQSKVTLGNSSSTVKFDVTGDGTQRPWAIYAEDKADVKISGSDITFAATAPDASSDTRTLQVKTGAKLSVDAGSTGTVNIVTKGNESAIGVIAMTNGELNITAKEVNITSDGWGIHAQNNNDDGVSPTDAAKISINAEKTTIIANSIGIGAFSHGQVNISGDLTVTAEHAIDVRGNSIVNINQDGNGTVVLNGDIVFETPNAPDDAQNSGKIINADVNINLSTAESSWTGRAYQSYRIQNEGEYTDVENVELTATEYNGNVTDFEVNMSNGATWNVTGDSFINTANISDGATIVVSEDAKVLNSDKIDLNGGVLTLEGDATQQVNVNTLSGTGGTINVATAIKENGTFSTANLNIATVDSTETAPVLAVKYTGITADDLSSDVSADLEKLGEQSLTLGEGQTVAQTRIVDEGDIRGEVIQTVDETGAVAGTTQAANTKLTDFSSVNAMSLVQWRNEINHLTKRLGDIRASEGTIGAWARVYGGESQWGGANEVEMDHTTIQVGGD